MGEASTEYIKPVEERGCFGGRYFVNPWVVSRTESETSIFDFLWRSMTKSKPTKQELESIFPVKTPSKEQLENPTHGLKLTWLGHASCLVQLEGYNILTDPITSERCSPFSWLGPKRYTRPPLTIAQLPDIDAVIISHNHYDHLDVSTVKQLHKRFKEKLRWFVPMGLKEWFTNLRINNVSEMTWWDEDSLHEKIKVVCLPVQHFSNRGLHDNNVTLWAGWAIIGEQNRFFFGGDTAYCTGFKEIGKKYGPFTASAIPIGAYCPRSMMSPIHVDPEEAVKIHQDVRSLKSIGIHWGTFDLSLEPYMEPKEKLVECAEAVGLQPDEFITIQHGETLHLNTECQEPGDLRT